MRAVSCAHDHTDLRPAGESNTLMVVTGSSKLCFRLRPNVTAVQNRFAVCVDIHQTQRDEPVSDQDCGLGAVFQAPDVIGGLKIKLCDSDSHRKLPNLSHGTSNLVYLWADQRRLRQ